MISNDNIKLIPKISTSKKYIELDFPDIKVSQCEYKEGPVGLTYIHFNKGVKCFMDVRGGWPAYLDCLSNNDKNILDGINISGGSLLGLESTTGLIAESLKKYKYKSWQGINGSIIYSNNLFKNTIYPDKNLGRFAFNNYSKKLYNGQVGAGLSASHGQGWGYKELTNGIKILGLVVNNAIGSVYKNNKLIHKSFDLSKVKLNKNTTIIVLITNLKLDYFELKQMNNQVNVSIGESIRPFNTFVDGDVFYTCSTEKIKNNFNVYQMINFFDECSKVIKQAIHNSIL